MKNGALLHLKNRMKLKIQGRNIERFIHKLVANHIDLLEIEYQKNDQAVIRIYQKDFKKIKEIKTIYDITIIGHYGMSHLKCTLWGAKELIASLVIGLCFLFLLTNLIFKVEVIHTDKEVRAFLLKELDEYGLKEKVFRKGYQELEEIKKKIVNKNHDKIEWLEIENIGTSYIVRVEMRKLPLPVEQFQKQSVVAKKTAIIKRVIAKNGVVVRTVNDYVKKGEVIISGEVKLNEEVKNTTQAKGQVFGEVWYQTQIEYPLYYKEVNYTGKKKSIYGFTWLSHRFDLFDFRPFQNKSRKDHVIWKHPLLPFTFVKSNQTEEERIEKIYTEEEAIQNAIKLGKSKIESKLSDKEKVIRSKNLKVNVKESKIILDVFYTVYEDITEYQKIEDPVPIVPTE